MTKFHLASIVAIWICAWGSAIAEDSPRITFHDALSGEDLTSLSEASFSVPRPIVIIDPVVLGAPEDHPGKTTLEHDGGAKYRIRVTGMVYDFIADGVASGRANIENVEIRSQTGGLLDHVRLETRDGPDVNSIGPHAMAEQLAHRSDMARAIRPYPFVGRFETRIYTLPVSTGSNPLYVSATNINKGDAVATIDIEATVNREAQRYELATEIRNHTDVGLYNPVVVHIDDPAVTPDNVEAAGALVNGAKVGLRFIGGKLQIDRPIMGLSRVDVDGVPNLVNVTGRPDHFQIRYKGIDARFHWSYTAAAATHQ